MADRLIGPNAAPRPDALPLGGRPLARARGVALPGGALAGGLALGAILAVHVPVLGHYFFGDDFVPLADIASRSTGGYLRDLFLLRDLTPNWRFLTGLAYLGLFRAFGLSALPYLLLSVLLHLATAGLLFWLVRRATGNDWTGALAAALFGLSASHVPTVGQVTALNNVLAAFLLMLAVVALYEAIERELAWPFVASATAFGGAIAANESTAVLAPVLWLVAFWRVSQRPGPPRWGRALALSAPYAALGGAALAAFASCDCTEAHLLEPGGHVLSNVWLYLGRLLFPVGLEFPGQLERAHFASGIAVAVVAGAAFARGPALARISAVFLVLTLLPYLPIELWSASRYTYLGAIPFAVLGALLFAEAGRRARALSPALPALVAALAIGVLGVYSWQSWEQNETMAAQSDRWRTLVTQLRATGIEPPPGSTVYVRGGPVTDFYFQCAVLPAVGGVLWGDVKLFTFLEGSFDRYRIRPGYAVYVLDARGDRLVPVTLPLAGEADRLRADVTLLPHVSPGATGNLCLPGVATPS